MPILDLGLPLLKHAAWVLSVSLHPMCPAPLWLMTSSTYDSLLRTESTTCGTLLIVTTTEAWGCFAGCILHVMSASCITMPTT